ncbi:MAG: mechanosensitive ion channel [Thermoanaerobaculia bacterium]|nr:mechanosensitive ion channel [Thermoanaerobaculia bacterium]
MNDDFLIQTLSTLKDQVVTFLPLLLAAFLVLSLGVLTSLVIRWIVGRFLRRVGLDRWLSGSDLEQGLQSAGVTTRLSDVIARLVFWLLVFSTVVVTLGVLGVDLSGLPVSSLVAYLPSVVGALLVLVGGSALATLAGRTTQAALKTLGVERGEAIGRIARLLILAITLIVTVDQLGFDVALLATTFTNLLTLVVAGLIVAFAWGGKEIARAILAGHYVRKIYREGDHLAVDDRLGTLVSVGSLTTELDQEGRRLVVPNHRLLDSIVAVVARGEGPNGDPMESPGRMDRHDPV